MLIGAEVHLIDGGFAVELSLKLCVEMLYGEFPQIMPQPLQGLRRLESTTHNH